MTYPHIHSDSLESSQIPKQANQITLNRCTGVPLNCRLICIGRFTIWGVRCSLLRKLTSLWIWLTRESTNILTFQAYPSILTEAWEPMAPSQVKSDYQLVEYAGALLRNFGPQRVATDVPWRIFTATLSTAVDWPTDPVKIMHFVRIHPLLPNLYS